MKEPIHTDNAPGVVGPYSQAIKHGNTLYLAGQIALIPEEGKLLQGSITQEVNQIMKNINAVLEEAGLTFDNALKVTIYMTDINDYAEVNSAYGAFLSEPFPAREALAVRDLPAGAKVEISVIAGY
jgi:2-iminobutanoate/2-iminopropanoate deaminase